MGKSGAENCMQNRRLFLEPLTARSSAWAATRVSTASVSLQLLFNIKITTMVIPLLVRDLFDQAINLLPVPHLLSDDKFCHRDSFNSTITAFKRGHQKRGKLLPDLCHRKL